MFSVSYLMVKTVWIKDPLVTRSLLPVLVLEGLVSQQVSETETGRQRRHLALLLFHPESGDV